MDGKTISFLQLPQFKIKQPASFKNIFVIGFVLIFTNYYGVHYSCFDWHNASGMTKAAEYVLEKLRSVVIKKELWIDIPLNPSDAVTFLNQRVLHTSNSFSYRYEGTDRWLLRVFELVNKSLSTQILNPKICEYHLRIVKENHV
ncbi:hypothetical protein [Bartonella sp. DGB1]|uniref:hypothetical protein n=1 Tax=Bartonella sp. DGB1 TaxID=3239807 RepID=UPI00352617C2